MPSLAEALASGPAAPPPSADEGPDALAVAGQELADAIKSGDGAAVASAFKAMKDLCESTDYAEAE
jgi:hypothetical protein